MPPKKKSTKTTSISAISLDHYFESRNARYATSKSNHCENKFDTLSRLSIKVLATHLQSLKNTRTIDLSLLPSSSVDELFHFLRVRNVQLAPTDWIDLFFDPDILVSELIFDDIKALEHIIVWKHLGQLGGQLSFITKLSINHLQIPDRHLIGVVRFLPSLTFFSARANSKLTNKTAEALLKHCGRLEYVNLSLTMVKDECIRLVTIPSLQTLKLASVNINQNSILDIVKWSKSNQPLSLQNVKLRASKISETSLVQFLEACGSKIITLDLLGTNIHHPRKLTESLFYLKKLNLSYTQVSGADVGRILSFHTLECLIVGRCPGIYQSHVITWVPSVTSLTRLDLFSNEKIYDVSGLISSMPKLRHLDVSYTRIDHTSFHPWLNGSFIPPVEFLNVSGTHVDDQISPAIETIGHTIEDIFLEGTRITNTTVEVISKKCPFVKSLNLDKCRGIPIQKRRTALQEFRTSMKKSQEDHSSA